ncbi:MAG TPA: hypothetical protein IAA49_01595, partial [Candidatus Alistipes pullicola]|nr:hypothetical protein [Candidatus Alistipes pullicola]
EAGSRTKMAVWSNDPNVDPVGACVGMKGSRIYSIVKELRNENIDVVNYTTNTQLYIQRALNPAKISSIKINEESKTAAIYLKPNEVSLAIGKGGLNIRLASMLTGYDIDVYRELDNEDVSLDEFKDRIDGWIIDKLKSIGCDTVKSTLALSADELAKRSDLEIETAQEIINILQSENEDVELDEFRDEIDEQIIDKLKQTGLSTAKSVIDQPIDELVKRTGLDEKTLNEVIDILKSEFE